MQLAQDIPHVLRIEHKTGGNGYCKLHRYAVTLSGNAPVDLGAVKAGGPLEEFDIDMPTTVDPVNSPTMSLARYYVSGGNSYSEVVLRSGSRRYKFYAF
jgi:hypothetical protein